MITAENFFNQYGGYTREEMLIRAREFAKLHVVAALKEACEKTTTTVHKHIHDKDEIDGYILIEIINKDSILNAYSLENIK